MPRDRASGGDERPQRRASGPLGLRPRDRPAQMAAEPTSSTIRIGFGACWWVCAVAVTLLGSTRSASGAEFVFRVPEVLVRHAAADRPVGSARADRSPTTSPSPARPPQPEAESSSSTEQHYEEYFVEHSISTVDAREAARAVDLEQVGAVEGCGACGPRERAYCEARVLADHCCCERRYLREPMPWLPHTCYVGAEICRPAAGNCARYARLRDCCCLHRLAAKWKDILLSGRAGQPISTCRLLLSAVLAVLVMR